MRRALCSVVAVLATAVAANAAPILFNFESVATGNYSSLPMTAGGLTATVTRTGGNQFSIGDISGFGAPASWGNRTMDNFSFLTPTPGNPYNVNFSDGVSSVSIQFGDFFADDDTPVTMQAWSGLNGTGTLLGTDSKTWLGSDGFPSFGTLSLLSGTPIRSITFTGGGSFPNSLYWDNLRAELAAVPEPVSMVVFGGLLAAGGLAVRRRVKATVA